MRSFTPLAQQCLAKALFEAMRLNQPFVCLEHMLMAMLDAKESGARVLLARAGLDTDKLRAAVAASIAGELPAPTQPRAEIPYTPLMKKALAMAQSLAAETGVAGAGTQHILVAMARLSYNPFVVILKELRGEAEAPEVSEVLGAELDAAAAEAFACEDQCSVAKGDNPAETPGSGIAGPPVAESAATGQHTPDWAVGLTHTPRAAQALALTRKVAARLGSRYISTEHLLLALLEMHAIPEAVLRKCGVAAESLRHTLELAAGTGADEPSSPHELTPRLTQVLALAVAEARRMSHPETGVGHVAIALLREGSGVACKVLQGYGIQLHAMRLELERAFDFNRGATPPQEHGAAYPADVALAPGKVQATVTISEEILHGAVKLGMILDDYIEHLYRLHLKQQGDAQA
ncbi:hypothetical protein DB346_15595 [Verrucomicrobia bacterium LW23]|nr:hypothetical protein DB346_15595 [Verrucomicrobia bacterium LW23]